MIVLGISIKTETQGNLPRHELHFSYGGSVLGQSPRQPLALGEHALLVTARTEVASLAGIGQQVVMAALIAEDSREPLMQVAAVEKALEDLGLYRPVDQSGGIKIIAVSSHTLVQRTCPRIARAVDTARRRLRVLAHRLGASVCTARP